ncbi:hypothetical protein Goshw_008078 [Gossypium schwendimanii]|uniref:Uncharacterized protein n=1 Tax=Gossypium schwendimanii TaxID=34291 RepID=A0A7J9N0Y5_GOSSC|nr:hypothetical protein [Gossypium schwendimanii]
MIMYHDYSGVKSMVLFWTFESSRMRRLSPACGGKGLRMDYEALSRWAIKMENQHAAFLLKLDTLAREVHIFVSFSFSGLP